MCLVIPTPLRIKCPSSKKKPSVFLLVSMQFDKYLHNHIFRFFFCGKNISGAHYLSVECFIYIFKV